MSPVKKAVAAQTGGTVDFGKREFYAGGSGFDLPKGRYALEFTTQLFQPTKQDGSPAGDSYLAVMLTCHPLAGGEPIEKPLSLGRKAKLSFVPSSDGKGLVPVAGGPASTVNDQTNWSIFRQSLDDCGLPEGIFTNDLSVLDGVHVQTDNVPEPESRTKMKSRTSEGQQEERKGSGLVPVVVEILEDGKPWEGTGGFDNLGEEKPKAAAKAPLAKAPLKAVASGKKAAPAPVEEEEAGVDADVEQAALSAVSTFLEANPNGCPKLLMRTGVFTAIKKADGDDVAQEVQNAFFSSDAALNGLIGQLGYALQGGMVKPIPA